MENYDADIAAVQSVDAVPSILDVVCRSTGMGFAAVARVTEDRWIACQVLDNIHFGLEAGGELKVETTLCNDVRQNREIVVFDNADDDPIYCGHLTPNMYGLKSYISVPIILPDGRFFGTLCAIDPQPHKVNKPEIIGTFKLFAELIAYHLDAGEKLSEANSSLKSERAAAELREQFIAVLGHDLRNPLASLDSGTSLLLRETQSEKSLNILAMMRKSASRMSELIDNVLDFARGRLGGGIVVDREAGGSVALALNHVLSEIRSSHPDREIEADIDLPVVIEADPDRIGQLFSNLLGNAIAHGDGGRPVRVNARLWDGKFELTVSNAGEPIAPAALDNLFQPFTRGRHQPNRQGLGLGLYIASQIAQAHGGRIDVASDSDETRFTFRMPLTGRSADAGQAQQT